MLRWEVGLRLAADLDLGVSCPCCGSTRFTHQNVLWPKLIDEWGLSPREAEYLDLQQGGMCRGCRANLRGCALAAAVLTCCGFEGTLRDFVRSETTRSLSVLEINRAGRLTQFFCELPNHRLVEYPDMDMQDLNFEDASFDLVVHSDTLEHVPDPVRGLAECARVLKPGGHCVYTVPIVVDRLSRRRDGLPASYHGSPNSGEDQRVVTEYGGDAAEQLGLAGFREGRIVPWIYPVALALVGVK